MGRSLRDARRAHRRVRVSRRRARRRPPDDDFFGLLSADEVFVGVPTMRGLCDGLRAAARHHLVIDHPRAAR